MTDERANPAQPADSAKAGSPSEPLYLRPYREAVDTLGVGFDALLWKSPQAQTTRFEVARRMARLRGRVVADLGCGTGDFLRHLRAKDHAPSMYVGVEGIAELAGAAERALEGASPARVLTADFVGDADLPGRLVAEFGVSVFALSGSLNTLEQGDAIGVLGRLWRAIEPVAGGLVVFNFLSSHNLAGRTTAEPPATRFDTPAMVAWALSQTPLVRFRNDYLAGHDATITMRRPARSARPA